MKKLFIYIITLLAMLALSLGLGYWVSQQPKLNTPPTDFRFIGGALYSVTLIFSLIAATYIKLARWYHLSCAESLIVFEKFFKFLFRWGNGSFFNIFLVMWFLIFGWMAYIFLFG